MSNDYSVKVQAKVDISSKEVNAQIKNLEKSINKIKISGQFDDAALKNLSNQLNNLKATVSTANLSPAALDSLTTQINQALASANIQIKIPNLNVGNLSNQAKQAGNQVGQNISNGINTSISKSINVVEQIKKSLNEINSKGGKLGFTINDKNIDSVASKITNLVKQVDSLSVKQSSKGKIIINASGLDEFGNKIKVIQTAIKDLQSDVLKPLNTTSSIISTKEFETVEKAISNYTSKFAQFKSTYNEILSGLSSSIKEFETKLSGLKNGASTINEVANAFNNLKTEASNITSNLSKQLNPIDSAISKIAKGKETIKGLTAENKGLANSSKEVESELKKASSLLSQINKIESEQGRNVKWASTYKEFSSLIDQITAKLKVLKKEQSNASSTQIFNMSDLKKANIPYMSKISNTINSQSKEIQKMLNANNWKLDNISGIEQVDGQIKKLTITVRDAEGTLKSFNMERAKLVSGKGNTYNGLIQSGDVKVLETASQAQTKLAQETEKANAKLAEQAKLSISNGNASAQIEILSTGFKKIGLSAEEVMSKMRNVTTEYNVLESMLKSGASNADIANQFNKMNSALKQTQNDLKQTRSEYSLLATTQQRLALANKIEAWNQKNTAATQKVRQANEQYIASLRDLNTQMTLVEKNNIATSFKNIENSMRRMGKLGLALKDQWKQAVSSFSVWLSASTAVMKVVSETRQAFTEIKEIDTLLTEISKTDWSLTSSDLKQIGSNAFSVASDYGKTATDYLSGVKDMSRAGYDNAEAMAELSVAAQGAGDMTSEVANKMVIATDKAYKMNGSVDELTKTLDGVNWINIMVQLYGNT